jgi:hypothetical protein
MNAAETLSERERFLKMLKAENTIVDAELLPVLLQMRI